MKPMESARNERGLASRRRRSKGSELLEFTLVLIPLLATVTVLADMAWAVFAESTIQRAVRVGVRTGVTLTSSQMGPGACLTDTIKGIVQTNSFGLLKGSAGLALIKVNYFLPPAPASAAAATDVSAQNNGNAPGNIIKVSVQNFSLIPLMPRIYSAKLAVDNSPLVMTNINSADIIEPDRNPPCIGTAP